MADQTSIVLADRLSPEQTGAVEDLVARAARSDGFSALNEAALLGLRHGEQLTHLVATEDRHGRAATVGYAQLRRGDDHDVAALVVSPAARGHGVGSRLLEAMQLRADGRLRIWATADTPAARALAGRHGLQPVRRLLIMRRSLEAPLTAPPVPPGVVIRPFRRGEDEDAWVEVNRRAFATHPEQGSVTRGDFELRTAEPWFEADGLIVAERAGVMVGFHWTKQHPDQLGEVYVLGVDPSAGIKGLGGVLLVAGLEYLRSRGNREVELYVESDNDPALRLYHRFDFAVTSADVMYGEAAGHQENPDAPRDSLATIQVVRQPQEM